MVLSTSLSSVPFLSDPDSHRIAMANLSLCPCRSVFPRRPSSTVSRMVYQRGSLFLPFFSFPRRLRISEVRCIQNGNDPKRRPAKRDVLQSDAAVGSSFKAEEIGRDELVSSADAIVPIMEVLEEKEGIDWKWPPWETHLPLRYRIIGASSLAFVICNMDKVLSFLSPFEFGCF